MSVTDQERRDRGVVFGPYRVFDRLGVGGMATVHRAKEIGIEGFERWVALKRLLPHLAEDESFVRAFVREAKLASLLTHPGVVQIYELGRVGHVYFISMELIDGFDVRQILRQSRRVTGPPPLQVTVSILAQVCDALEYAHTRVDDEGRPLGLVHRDVSPSNVIVSHDGHVKIIDFGIAKAQTQHLQTQTGRVKGKMAYMAPEAIRGLQLDGRSDLFSLGVLAHEMLTARPLFATKNDYKTLQRVQNAIIAPPSTYNRDCPPELDAIVLRALERDRDERWDTAGELRDELYRLRKQYNLTAQPREVADWLMWAFTVEAPATQNSGPHRAVVETPQPHSSDPSMVIEIGEGEHAVSLLTPPTGPSRMPVQGVALPTAEEDEEIIEIAWGGRSQNQAVVLDEVPDVSARIGSSTPSGALAAVAPGRERTLITPAPPPPRTSTAPRSWATGTQPPGVEGDEDVELSFDPFALGPPPQTPASMPVPARVPRAPRASSAPPLPPAQRRAQTRPPERADTFIPLPDAPAGRTPTGALSVRPPTAPVIPRPTQPVVARSTTRPPVPRAPTAPPRQPTAPPRPGSVTGEANVPAPVHAAQTTPARTRQHRPTQLATQSAAVIGSGLVDRERGRRRRAWIAAVAAAVLLGAGAFALLRTNGDSAGAGAATAPVPAAKVNLIVEPADAIIEITGGDPARIEGSPATTHLAPGRYPVTVKRDGYKPWSSTLEIEAGETQTLRIALAPVSSAGAGQVVVQHSNDDETDRATPHHHHRVEAPTLDQPDQPLASAGKTEPSSDGVAALPHIATDIASEPPPAEPRRPSEPLVVPPNAVHKRFGTLPRLRARAGEVPHRIAAQLCIDSNGAVTSTTVLSNVSDDVRARLEAAFGTWRYAPYRHHGRAVPACFAVSATVSLR